MMALMVADMFQMWLSLVKGIWNHASQHAANPDPERCEFCREIKRLNHQSPKDQI